MSGDGWLIGSLSGPTYPGGNQILLGQLQADNDLWFREGPATTVVQSATWGRIKGLYHPSTK